MNDWRTKRSKGFPLIKKTKENLLHSGYRYGSSTSIIKGYIKCKYGKTIDDGEKPQVWIGRLQESMYIPEYIWWKEPFGECWDKKNSTTVERKERILDYRWEWCEYIRHDVDGYT